MQESGWIDKISTLNTWFRMRKDRLCGRVLSPGLRSYDVEAKYCSCGIGMLYDLKQNNGRLGRAGVRTFVLRLSQFLCAVSEFGC